jgi:hypothetical protein
MGSWCVLYYFSGYKLDDIYIIGRTRLSQARAELGMTDRTGGPSSSNYHHRQRPEKYDEDDEADSDGEDITILKTRSGQPIADNEEERKRTQQDTALAISLRSRAISVEKVVNSMLEQPPPLHLTDGDFMIPPSSSKMTPTSIDAGHLQHLPNGARLSERSSIISLPDMRLSYATGKAPPCRLHLRSYSVSQPTVPCLPKLSKR